MRILVAGGAGYIGSVLVPKLAAADHQVEVVDLLWFGNHLPREIPLVQRDILDLELADLEGFDQVIFLAGLSNDPMAEFSPRDNFIQNAAAPGHLVYLAKRARVRRFIYAGSCSVYGFTDAGLFDEESPSRSEYPYGIAKLQGERAVLQLADERFSTICLRQGTVGGYSPRMRFDLVVNTMFKTAMQTASIIIDNPDIWRPILSISDAAHAYLCAIEAEPCLSGVFNIASANYTVGQIATMVKGELEPRLGKQIRLSTNQRPDCRSYKVSTRKASGELGFQPVDDIGAIVRSLYDNLGRFGDFDDENFYNIRRFRTLKAAEQLSV